MALMFLPLFRHAFKNYRLCHPYVCIMFPVMCPILQLHYMLSSLMSYVLLYACCVFMFGVLNCDMMYTILCSLMCCLCCVVLCCDISLICCMVWCVFCSGMSCVFWAVWCVACCVIWLFLMFVSCFLLDALIHIWVDILCIVCSVVLCVACCV